MAAATAANVTVFSHWDEGDKQGKFIQFAQRCMVALNGQGGTTGDIPAAIFGLASITEVYASFLDASGTVTWQPVYRDVAGTQVIPASLSTGAAANVTGNLHMIVKGNPIYPTNAT